ncbi:PAS domain S-box protein [Aliifodinibius sp. S!AR15-10]|uniref:PAS domain-containing protein n=1 Tax=Aliifodinibius sp. S!AR15-10 TaxID=2950437 RepID=UPI002865D3BD|nr:PAS domain S-box protein [Aliifodinibius sp. S!AR15-10]MDR8393007.1 PAS domain S-box protein [Aliifodinibius sp. S!AR15-10]
MESNWKQKIKELSKNEEARKELENLFAEVIEEREQFQSDLSLLEAAIKNDYDSILITELDLEEPGPRIVYVNDGFTKMTGYSREEVIGKTPRILQGPKTDRAVLDKLKNRLKEGKSFFGQAVNYRKDGSEFVNQWDIHPLTDEEGNITHWVSYQHDITQRKRAEKVLIDTQKEFDELRESSQKTVLDVDLQGTVVMANKAFRELVGYSKDELKQMKVWDFFPKKYRDSLKKRFDDGADEERFDGRHFKGIIRHKNNVPIQIEGNTTLLDLKDGTLIRADINNISMQKRIIDTLKKRNHDFGRIVKKASEFTYRLQLKNGEPLFETVSEEFPIFTGLSSEIVQEKGGFKKFVHEEDLEKVKEHYKKVLEGQSCTCSYRVHTADEDYVEIVDYAKPEWDNSNKSVVCISGAVSLKHENEAAV